MSDRIQLVRHVRNPVSGGPNFVPVCCHRDDCIHGAHGAAVHLLKGLKVMADGGGCYVPDADGSYLGVCDPCDLTFEASYTEVGMQFEVTDCVSVDFEEGEVRVVYWWGNSGLYFPFTMEQWNEALDWARKQP